MAKTPGSTTIEASWLDPDGRGVGMQQDLEVHVTDLLPGERASATIDHQSPHRPVAWATRGPLLGPASPHRAEPACPAFGQCGGCAWQHCDESMQLEAKARSVRVALAEHMSPCPEVLPTIAAPAVIGYRSRGKYVVSRGPDGGLAFGAYQARSHEFVDTHRCCVVEPVIRDALASVRQGLEQTRLSPYDEASQAGHLRYLVVRSSFRGEVTVAVVTSVQTPERPVADAATRLVREGHVAGVVWVRNPSRSGAILAGSTTPLAGVSHVSERFGDVTVDLDMAGFTQVNRHAAAAMYRTLVGHVAHARRAVDLYCGAGAIAFYLEQAGIAVLGIERHAPAVEAARRAAARCGSLATFQAADAEGAASLMHEFAPDLVVVNPPRKGLGPEVVGHLLRASPATIAYLSCGPRSLARDLSLLTRGDFCIDVVQPFDLMPGTSQVETLVVLRRTDQSAAGFDARATS